MIKKLSQYVLFLFCLLGFSVAHAWDSTGHRIVAMIAYENLMPQAKHHVDQLTESGDRGYPGLQRFLYAAVWPDFIRGQDVSAFNAWHYIDRPFSRDGAKPKPENVDNVVWAIGQAEQVLASQKSTADEKSVFLRFLIHFAGDIEQPLHNIELYSKRFPNGDLGGNLFPVKTRYAQYLHQYWDQGLGFYRLKNQTYPLRTKAIRRVASQIMQAYPKAYFAAKIRDPNVQDWSDQSFQVAKNFAYNIKLNAKPSQSYVVQGRKIVEQQLALGGYRLAQVLNQLYH